MTIVFLFIVAFPAIVVLGPLFFLMLPTQRFCLLPCPQGSAQGVRAIPDDGNAAGAMANAVARMAPEDIGNPVSINAFEAEVRRGFELIRLRCMTVDQTGRVAGALQHPELVLIGKSDLVLSGRIDLYGVVAAGRVDYVGPDIQAFEFATLDDAEIHALHCRIGNLSAGGSIVAVLEAAAITRVAAAAMLITRRERGPLWRLRANESGIFEPMVGAAPVDPSPLFCRHAVLPRGETFNSAVICSRSVTIEDNVRVRGCLKVNGDLTIGDGVMLEGGFVVTGNVWCRGLVQTGDAALIGRDAHIGGPLVAGRPGHRVSVSARRFNISEDVWVAGALRSSVEGGIRVDAWPL